ncbi:MAG: glycerol-3-phosphate 1-O-acyltransferase PlsY [Vicinamibacterales bacterium]
MAGASERVLLVLLAAYLVGSLPFAWLTALRVAGIDIRIAGSGNLGAANVFRTTGSLPGIAVALMDVSKGAFAVWIARRAGLAPAGCTAAGLAAVAGHVYPVWLRFRGGKGVATTCGVFTLLAPPATAFSVAIFLIVIRLTGYVSVGSIAATVALGPLAYLTGAPAVVVAGALVAGTGVVARHWQNIGRVRAGTERRFLQSGDR